MAVSLSFMEHSNSTKHEQKTSYKNCGKQEVLAPTWYSASQNSQQISLHASDNIPEIPLKFCPSPVDITYLNLGRLQFPQTELWWHHCKVAHIPHMCGQLSIPSLTHKQTLLLLCSQICTENNIKVLSITFDTEHGSIM